MARIPLKALFISKLLTQLQMQIFDHGVQNLGGFDNVMAWVRQHPEGQALFDQTHAEERASRFIAMQLRGQLEAARVVLAKASQLEEFRNAPLPPTKLPLIFDPMWLEFDHAIPQVNQFGRHEVKGVLVFTDKSVMNDLMLPVRLCWMVFVSNNGRIPFTFCFSMQGNVLNLKSVKKRVIDMPEHQEKMPLLSPVLAFLYLLSDPYVRVETDQVQHQALQKLRRKSPQAKDQHKDFYNVVLIEHHPQRTSATGTGGHKARHAVRGHWRVIRRHPRTQELYPEARATWVRPHLRGHGDLAVQSLWKLRDKAA